MSIAVTRQTWEDVGHSMDIIISKSGNFVMYLWMKKGISFFPVCCVGVTGETVEFPLNACNFLIGEGELNMDCKQIV